MLILILSAIAKILSFFVRIIMGRTLSSEAMSYYSLAQNTMIFIITLAQMGIPMALSKVIAQNPKYFRHLKAGITMTLFNNIILTFSFILLIPLLAKMIYGNSMIIPVLWAIVPLIPLVSFSGLLKGYFLGKQRQVASNACQISEEVVRIIFVLLIFTWKKDLDPISMATIAMLSMAAGEMGTIIHLGILLPSKKQIRKLFPHSDDKPQKDHFDAILALSLPMTASRFIGSFFLFLEPMIITRFAAPFLKSALLRSYTTINAYIMPLLSLPSFATLALGNWLLSSFSYYYSRKRKKTAIRMLKGCLLFSLTIGCLCCITLSLFSKEICDLFYHKITMAPQLEKMAFPFILLSIQPILSNILHALNKSKAAMIDSLIGSLIRCMIFLLGSEIFLLDTSWIAITSGMIITTCLHGFNVIKAFLNHK